MNNVLRASAAALALVAPLAAFVAQPAQAQPYGAIVAPNGYYGGYNALSISGFDLVPARAGEDPRWVHFRVTGTPGAGGGWVDVPGVTVGLELVPVGNGVFEASYRVPDGVDYRALSRAVATLTWNDQKVSAGLRSGSSVLGNFGSGSGRHVWGRRW